MTPSKAELDDTTDTSKDGITGTLKDTVGVKNSYRYRGYRYDAETGLYYLQSRYYNPEWGRFLNADVITGVKGALFSHNMFAYCRNNPIIFSDPSGYNPLLISMGVGASYIGNQWAGGENVNPFYLGVNTVFGGAAGWIGGAGAFKDIGPSLQNLHLQAINAAYGQTKSGAFGKAVNGFVTTAQKAVVVNTLKSAGTGALSNFTGKIPDPFSNTKPNQTVEFNNPNPRTDFGYSIGFC